VRKATEQEVQILPGSESAALLDQSRMAGVGTVFRAEVLHGRMPIRPAHLCNLLTFRAPQSDGDALSAGRGRPARTPFALLVWALPVVVPASKCGVCRVSLIGPRICWRVGGRRDIPVEALFPQDRERFELGSSGWSRVLGIDAIGSPPHCDFADQGDARVTSR
jgi:hypothetical protein